MAAYSKLSDWELTALLNEGDRLAYAEIYERYSWQLHAHAYKWMRDREETKDIIQELFRVIWEKHHAITFDHGLAAYLYTSVRNRIFDLLSRKRNQSEYLVSMKHFMDEGKCETDHLIREKQLTAIIEAEISTMPKKMREVFELSRKQNLSHAQIADRLDISEQTVRKHIQHALQNLRVKLGLYVLLWYLMNK